MPTFSAEELQRRGARRMDRAVGLMTQAFFAAFALAVALYFGVLFGLVVPWL